MFNMTREQMYLVNGDTVIEYRHLDIDEKKFFDPGSVKYSKRYKTTSSFVCTENNVHQVLLAYSDSYFTNRDAENLARDINGVVIESDDSAILS